MALTLPSSNGASSYHTARPETIQINSHFNGGLTQTTATVTPTRLKNIEDAFREHSILPPKPEKHQHMAGFATPSVNISLLMKPSANFNFANITLNQASHEASRPIEYYNNSSTNSNSNDSFGYSDEYSSEASSSAFENSRLSFSNIAEMNGNNSSSGRSKKASTATSKSRKSNQSATNMAGSSQQKAKKSTGGGRKPVRNDKLTPEEELKRAKRRERNKLAAARCRKRRLDQTNTLSEQVTDLEDKHIDLANQLNDLLAEMRAIKNSIDSHQTSFSCKNKSLTYSADLFAVLDYEAMQEAMKQIEDDDDLSELSITAPNSPAVGSRVVVKSEPPHSMVSLNNISSATSVIVSNSSNLSANLMSSLANVINQQQQFQAVSSTSSASPTTSDSGTSLKRKRPNTLPVSNPYKAASVSESSTTFNSNALQTPSSGLLFSDCFESGTGLTPLIPSLTPSALTPSTMAAFVKSLGSPMDDSDPKKLIII